MTDDDRKTLQNLKGDVAHMQQVVVGTEQIVREATGEIREVKGELRQIKDMLCDARPLVQRFGRLEAFMMLMAVSAVIVAGCAAIVAFQVIVG